MGSTARTSVHPRGDATADVQPYLDGFLGSVHIASTVTIQAANPAYLRQLADVLNGAATEMVERQLARSTDVYANQFGQVQA